MPNQHTTPAAFVIFGARSDLTHRKLIPALYNLYLDRWLPEHFAILGLNRTPTSQEEYLQSLRQGVDEFSRRGKAEDAGWTAFASHIQFIPAKFDDPEAYQNLKKQLDALDAAWNEPAERIFYQATPPETVATILPQLESAGLSQDRKRERIVLEKPFGHDLQSARALDQLVTGAFHEEQIYRIDHYLGKETVQNILAFRFANTLFEPIWDRRYIDHVQITVAEQDGVGSRGGYYEGAGALRDMLQNHLLQLLCLIAMEPPVSFNADEIRNKKVDVLHAIRPIASHEVPRHALRGQYGSGWIQGQRVQAYHSETGVAMDSSTATFAAVKFHVDNWRWQGVPFYLRTGKRLAAKASEISIQFHPVPHQSFPSAAIAAWKPNRLTLRIQPEESIVLRFQVKQPGQLMRLKQEEMRFSYEDSSQASHPEAYETLLLDVMLNDATLFMRADQVETAWKVVNPILEYWDSTPAVDFPNYQAGSWGPEAAEGLIAQDGRNWIQPPVPD